MARNKIGVLLLLFLFIASSNSQLFNCSKAQKELAQLGIPTPKGRRLPCFDLCQEEYVVRELECSNTSHCFFQDGGCYLKELRNASRLVQEIDLERIGQVYLREAMGKMQSGARTLPGSSIPFTIEQIQDLFPGISICEKFPNSCSLQYTSPDDLQPPLNIPYCQRIACRTDNPFLDVEASQCLSTPGCAFDYSLYLYRSVIGNAALFGVPVCHLAIRNEAFHLRANAYIKQGNAWNPILTDCLVQEYRDEIFGETRGCAMARVIRKLGYQVKRAGWKGISSRDCHLINGCWRENICFFPVSLDEFQVTSGDQQPPQFFNQPFYGRQACLQFDNDLINGEYLDAYHACSTAGCVVDVDRATLIRHLIGAASKYVPPPLQSLYRDMVLQGLVQAHNWREKADELIANSLLFPPDTLQAPQPFALTSNTDLSGLVQGGIDSFPENPDFLLPPCPYQNFQWPGFPPLLGSFEDCCKTPFCYIPRHAVRDVRSEIVSYLAEWTTWSPCSKTCGNGQQTRIRVCVGENCEDNPQEVRDCSLAPCPAYSQWSEYSSCNVVCGRGNRTRTRTCSRPNACSERLSESISCEMGRCPSLRIGHWSRCSSTCGMGMQQRRISCDRPGNNGCPKARIETRKCETFCGSYQYVKSQCDRETCVVTSTPQCVTGNRQPGHCRKPHQMMQVRTRKCYQGDCFCVHNPQRRHCMNKN